MKVARAIPALVLLAAACGDATPVTLRYRPAAGARFRYLMNQDVSMTSQGDDSAGSQQLSILIAFTQSVTGPVAGGTRVAVRVDSVSLTTPAMPRAAGAEAAQMLRGLESNIVFDERMQVVTSEVANAAGVPPQLANQIAAGLRGASFPLPDHALSVGDSWTVAMTAPTPVPGLNQPLTLSYRITLKALRVTAADTVVHLSLETSFPKDPLTLNLGGAPATMTINGSLRGEQDYSIVRGAIISVDLKGTVRVAMRGGPMGDGAMVMDQRLRLTLLEDAATP